MTFSGCIQSSLIVLSVGEGMVLSSAPCKCRRHRVVSGMASSWLCIINKKSLPQIFRFGCNGVTRRVGGVR